MIPNIPIIRTYNFFPHWEDTLVGYHWNLYHIQVSLGICRVEHMLLIIFSYSYATK